MLTWRVFTGVRGILSTKKLKSAIGVADFLLVIYGIVGVGSGSKHSFICWRNEKFAEILRKLFWETWVHWLS